MKSVLLPALFAAILFLTACSLYRSDGRKKIEGEFDPSLNAASSPQSLKQNCSPNVDKPSKDKSWELLLITNQLIKDPSATESNIKPAFAADLNTATEYEMDVYFSEEQQKYWIELDRQGGCYFVHYADLPIPQHLDIYLPATANYLMNQ